VPTQEPVASGEKDGARTQQPTTDSELEEGASKEERFLQLVSRKRQSLAAHLGSPESIEFSNPLLRIFTAPGDTWLSEALERSGNKEILAGCLTEIWGPSARWTILERALEDKAASEGKGSDPPGSDPVLQHPFIQTALEIFGGSAETVDTDPQSGDSNREHLP